MGGMAFTSSFTILSQHKIAVAVAQIEVQDDTIITPMH
jgi:hypothetical protein